MENINVLACVKCGFEMDLTYIGEENKKACMCSTCLNQREPIEPEEPKQETQPEPEPYKEPEPETNNICTVCGLSYIPMAVNKVLGMCDGCIIESQAKKIKALEEKQPEPQEPQPVLRFDAVTENKILTKLNKILSPCGNVSEEQLLKLECVFVLDPANCLGVQAKTEQAKRLMAKFVYTDDSTELKKYTNMPKLNYDAGELVESRYSAEYINKVFGFFAAFKDVSLTFRMKRDFPLSVENEHFKIILAPRVEND